MNQLLPTKPSSNHLPPTKPFSCPNSPAYRAVIKEDYSDNFREPLSERLTHINMLKGEGAGGAAALPLLLVKRSLIKSDLESRSSELEKYKPSAFDKVRQIFIFLFFKINPESGQIIPNSHVNETMVNIINMIQKHLNEGTLTKEMLKGFYIQMLSCVQVGNLIDTDFETAPTYDLLDKKLTANFLACILYLACHKKLSLVEPPRVDNWWGVNTTSNIRQVLEFLNNPSLKGEDISNMLVKSEIRNIWLKDMMTMFSYWSGGGPWPGYRSISEIDTKFVVEMKYFFSSLIYLPTDLVIYNSQNNHPSGNSNSVSNIKAQQRPPGITTSYSPSAPNASAFSIPSSPVYNTPLSPSAPPYAPYNPSFSVPNSPASTRLMPSAPPYQPSSLPRRPTKQLSFSAPDLLQNNTCKLIANHFKANANYLAESITANFISESQIPENIIEAKNKISYGSLEEVIITGSITVPFFIIFTQTEKYTLYIEKNNNVEGEKELLNNDFVAVQHPSPDQTRSYYHLFSIKSLLKHAKDGKLNINGAPMRVLPKDIVDRSKLLAMLNSNNNEVLADIK